MHEKDLRWKWAITTDSERSRDEVTVAGDGIFGEIQQEYVS
jgi:hypothetical protein